MVKWGKCLKRSLCCGLALTLILSGTSCGKEEMVADYYGVESEGSTEAVADNSEEAVTDNSEEADGIIMGGRSLTEAFGENITVNDAFTVGETAVSVSLDYKVPEESDIYVYEGGFIDETDDMEKQVVSSFFGGTEKNLEEIKYEDETTYIPLLYKYRSLLELQSAEEDASRDSFISISVIDSTFEEVYNWVDETTYSIHMYEGEYDGSRYGMIYSYDKARSTRYIYICPISITEYFPDDVLQTMFVVDPGSEYSSTNLCTMSDTDVMNDASVVLGKLGLKDENILFSYSPDMAIPEEGTFGTFGVEDTYTEMRKLVFSDSDMTFSIGKLNRTAPAGRTYAYKIFTGQDPAQFGETHSDDANLTENGYAIYLCSEPFSDKIAPTEFSTFNRGSIYYTDKGLFSVDISLVSEIDNVVEDVQLLSFDNIIECLKVAMEEDQVITQKSSGSLEVFSVDFTYVMVEDEENSGKITYVPAWYFVTEDKKLKSGENWHIFTHIINAIDGSNLKDKLR